MPTLVKIHSAPLQLCAPVCDARPFAEEDARALAAGAPAAAAAGRWSSPALCLAADKLSREARLDSRVTLEQRRSMLCRMLDLLPEKRGEGSGCFLSIVSWCATEAISAAVIGASSAHRTAGGRFENGDRNDRCDPERAPPGLGESLRRDSLLLARRGEGRTSRNHSIRLFRELSRELFLALGDDCDG